MPEPEQEKPRIIVDDDWKEQARREKEEADRITREQAKGPRELPAPSLAEIIQMIAIQVTIGLGGYQDPQTGQALPPDLPLAKHYIDLLELLQAKTAGQADEQEKKILEAALSDLRMLFVQVANHMSAAAAGQKPPQ